MNPFRRAATPVAFVLAIVPVAGHAQLISETVADNTRICTYYGTDTSPDGQVVPRTFAVGVGQDCPATAPYRDPDAAMPPNAMLTGERTGATSRICLYEESGLQYQVTVDLGIRCAMTPALLARERDGR